MTIDFRLTDRLPDDVTVVGAPVFTGLRVPDGETIEYDDLIRGPIAFQTDLIGDPVLVRASGAPLYNFAVVLFAFLAF